MIDSRVEPQYVVTHPSTPGLLPVAAAESQPVHERSQHMAEEAHKAEAAQMTGMPPMLAYTLRAPIQTNAGTALIKIGQGSSVQTLTPNVAKDQSYWIVILDANKPATIVQQWVTQHNKSV